MISLPCKFLLIAADEPSRLLLGRTLLRKFPMSSLLECASVASARDIPPERDLDIIVLHLAVDADELKPFTALRRRYPQAKIVVVSNSDQSRAAAAAGADRFLLRDEWLRLGTMVEDLLAAGPGGFAVA